MRRPKLDIADELLEWWARWLVSLELYDGTGDSMLSRLTEPRSGRPPRSRPLYTGLINHIMSQLDSRLSIGFSTRQRIALATLYGTPGHFYRIAHTVNVPERTLRDWRTRAREVAFRFHRENPID